MSQTAWYNKYKQISSIDRYLIIESIEKFQYKPLISIITPIYNTKLEWLKKCIESIKLQIYTNWEWCICDNGTTDKKVKEYLNTLVTDPRIKIIRLETNQGIAGGSNTAIAMATGDYSIFVDSDDLVPELTFYYIVDAIIKNPQVKFMYTDQVYMNKMGEIIDSYFKPDFSPFFLRSRNYIDHAKIFKTDLVKDLQLRDGYNGSQDYDLILRATENCYRDEIIHIPIIGYIWRQHEDSNSQTNVSWPIAGAIKALEDHLDRTGIKGKVLWEWPWYRIKYEVPEPAPRVGILICSMNKNYMLNHCIQNILRKTDYPHYTLYLCVPPSVKAKIEIMYKVFVDQSIIKFVERTETESYNFSVFNNRMVAVCTENLICQLNDDIEPINDSWLSELVGIGIQKGVGIVGSKLVYPNMNVQHVGCVLGIGGVCDHLFRNSHYMGLGYHGRARLIHDTSMVTAACNLMKKQIYIEAGGYEEDLAVSFNDVDFCIKVRELDYFNVLNPNSLLFHLESATRGYDDTPEKAIVAKQEGEYIIKKWGKLLQEDPFYNLNLALNRLDMTIAEKSRYKQPWLK